MKTDNLIEEVSVKEKKLTVAQRKLVEKHYKDALMIGQRFKSSVLYDDQKEDIAVRALIRAARTYDKNFKIDQARQTRKPKPGRSLFNTYLYQIVQNALLSAGRVYKEDGTYTVQQKRIEKINMLSESTIEARAAEEGRIENLSTMFAAKDVDHTEVEGLIQEIQLHLTERERFIFTALMVPDTTFEMIAEQLNISRQRVHQNFLSMRKRIQRLIKLGVIQWTIS